MPSRRTGRGSSISIHALREEGDPAVPGIRKSLEHFYPRPPRGGRRRITSVTVPSSLFLSTPSARRATVSPCHIDTVIQISIHALREEGDSASTAFLLPPPYFYPRPPRGGRPEIKRQASLRRKFLSTPSARRATLNTPDTNRNRTISIHALREEGDLGCFLPEVHRQKISIHALREEGDLCIPYSEDGFDDFYPRPPRGGRHGTMGISSSGVHISIHALREEGD